MNGRIPLILALAITLGFSSCHKPEAVAAFRFSFSVGNDTLQQDTLCYLNAAGNIFSVTEVQFFISKMVLEKDDGTLYTVQTDNGIHYADADIPSTLTWMLQEDHIPTGKYTRISFVFGLAPEYNVTHHFPNPPENSMSWPEALGGGYHHMKLNGKCLCQEISPIPTPYAMHLGTGQIYQDQQISGFVDNCFSVSLPLPDRYFSEDAINVLCLNMDVAEWFQHPQVYDFAQDGTATMQNQTAMAKLVANGQSVFNVR